MIMNEKQYRITSSCVKKFEKTLKVLLEEQKNLPDGIHPKMQQAHIDAVKSEIEALRRQLDEYDALRQGRVKAPALNMVEEVPVALIKARIAKGMTQEQLGQALGLKGQQIQRYEASLYSTASLSRVREVARILMGTKEG